MGADWRVSAGAASARSVAQGRFSSRCRRHPLHFVGGLRLEPAARGLSAGLDGAGLFLPMARRRHVGADQPRAVSGSSIIVCLLKRSGVSSAIVIRRSVGIKAPDGLGQDTEHPIEHYAFPRAGVGDPPNIFGIFQSPECFTPEALGHHGKAVAGFDRRFAAATVGIVCGSQQNESRKLIRGRDARLQRCQIVQMPNDGRIIAFGAALANADPPGERAQLVRRGLDRIDAKKGRRANPSR